MGAALAPTPSRAGWQTGWIVPFANRLDRGRPVAARKQPPHGMHGRKSGVRGAKVNSIAFSVRSASLDSARIVSPAR